MCPGEEIFAIFSCQPGKTLVEFLSHRDLAPPLTLPNRRGLVHPIKFLDKCQKRFKTNRFSADLKCQLHLGKFRPLTFKKITQPLFMLYSWRLWNILRVTMPHAWHELLQEGCSLAVYGKLF